MFLAEDHLPLRAVQRLPQADPALQRAAQNIGEPGVAALHLAQHGDRPQSGAGQQHRHDLALPYSASGSGRRRPRGVRFCDGIRGSVSSRPPVLAPKPALAAAVSRVWVLRRFMYNFAC